jgi:adenosylmethionine-8-amino-7-oxononanoate aminotransferase
VQALESGLRSGLQACASFPHVSDVRVLGAIGVVELQEPVDMKIVPPLFVERGVWVRPFGRLVYLMPPYVIGMEDLATLTSVVTEVVGMQGKM